MSDKLRGSISKRLLKYREEGEFTQQQMADKIGVSRANYANMEGGRQLPTLEQMETIVRISGKSYSFWIEGKNQPYKTTDAHLNILNEPKNIQIEVSSAGNKAIPVLDIQAAAGYPYNIDNPKFFKDCPVVSISWPEFKYGDHIMIQIKGDSMEPTLYHSDWVICRRLANPVEEIMDNYVHIIVTLDNGVVCKRVLNRLKTKEQLALTSDNTSYSTYIVKQEDILQVWRVVYKFSAILKNSNYDLIKKVNNLEADIAEIKNALKK